ncbi:MAG: TonB-dependent receptor [Bacteroidota bacterium]
MVVLLAGLWLLCGGASFEIESSTTAYTAFHSAEGRQYAALPPDAAGPRAHRDTTQVVPRDSLREYELAEIVVGTGRAERGELQLDVQRIPLADIAQQDGASIGALAPLIPAAHVQTNSRGETLIYLRGAGERQTALFFDGALLNIPWDNRVDLSLVPSTMVGRITVSTGAGSVLYGPNTSGGVINLVARELDRPSTYVEASLSAGTGALRTGQVSVLQRRPRWGWAGSISTRQLDGQTVPSQATLPFGQDGSLRTNTDLRQLSGYGRLTYNQGRWKLGLSGLLVDGAKGIAPEGHLDPSSEQVRYWRYPDWQMATLIVNGRYQVPRGFVQGVVWGSRFRQTIDQYDDAAYRTRTDRQDDEDATVGGRVTWTRTLNQGELLVAAHSLTSEHTQQERRVPSDHAAASLRYLTQLASLGAEWRYRPQPGRQWTIGLGAEGQWTPVTGDKPRQSPFQAWSGRVELEQDLNTRWTLRGAASHKARFPTLRELYGEALNRFALNPDLRPEDTWTLEAGAQYAAPTVQGRLTAFWARTQGTIDQERVTVTGDQGALEERRRRINLEGSRTVGLEAHAEWDGWRQWDVRGHATWLLPRALDAEAPRWLVERPFVMSTLTSIYRPLRGVAVRLDGSYVGRTYALDERSTLTRLPTSWIVATRLSYRYLVQTPRVLALETYLRVDNALNKERLPQLGLPAPGRTWAVGMHLTL